MTSALDAAAAVLEVGGPMDHMKLQKLLYYGQAWHLAWYGTPLFDDPIEAWSYGPVIETVYQNYKHYGRVPIEPVTPAPDLPERDFKALSAVVEAYGRLNGPELARLTHTEAPWPDARARANVGPDERSREEISPDALADYYGSEGVFGGQRAKIGPVDDGLAERALEGDTEALAALFEASLGVSVKSIHPA